MAKPLVRTQLERLAFTRDLGPADLDRLAEMASPARWAAGEIIYREGESEPAPRLYTVEEGRVALDVAVPGRGPMTILSVGAGEVFGWSSLLDPSPKAATARAVEPTQGLVLDADRLRMACEADPRLGYAVTRSILRVVCERLRGTRLQLLDVYR